VTGLGDHQRPSSHQSLALTRSLARRSRLRSRSSLAPPLGRVRGEMRPLDEAKRHSPRRAAEGASKMGIKGFMISFYSPQMVVTVNTTKYTIENDLTKKEKKGKKQTYIQTKIFHIKDSLLILEFVTVFILFCDGCQIQTLFLRMTEAAKSVRKAFENYVTV